MYPLTIMSSPPMRLEKLLKSLQIRGGDPCLVSEKLSYSYGDLERKRLEWQRVLQRKGIKPGDVVGLKADYSAESISLFLALHAYRCIVALVPYAAPQDDTYVRNGFVEHLFFLRKPDDWSYQRISRTVHHPLILRLSNSGIPGFTIFSSGSSGQPKAILHSLERFLIKFDKPGKNFRTLSFLLFDHIAGLDTLFYTLGNGGVLVLTQRRDPRSICQLIETHRVEVLPTSPTFLNLLCLSREYEGFDLSSLKIITYGSEPMSQSILNRLNHTFSKARIIQKYGASEFGSPRSLSKGNHSVWIKLKRDEVDAKVIDGILWIKSESAMIGYLNAPSPFDDQGWYCTGDLVEKDGDYIRFLGRKSEIINVGGAKVYPIEVESAILEVQGVSDVKVRGEPHPWTGQMVSASVQVRDGNREPKEFVKLIRKHCRRKLEFYKIPIKIEITNEPLISSRQKKPAPPVSARLGSSGSLC